jgi:AcrR family transcriptional regulator
MEKLDRRIQRTHKLLADALVALAQQRGYDSVTIRDITEYADISYSTFFRHYPDKDALLLDMIQNTVTELRTVIGEDQLAELSGNVLFKHIANNQALYQTLLGGLNSSAIVQRIQEIIVGEIQRNVGVNENTIIPPEIMANHIAASVLALVKWWLDHDMPYSSERMGEIYAALIIRPTLGKP